jgi:hypothetical protein
MVSWFALAINAIVSTMINPNWDHILRDFFRNVLLLLTTFNATSMIFTAVMSKSDFGLMLRAVVNVLCCTHLIYGWFIPMFYMSGDYLRFIYLVAAIMFAGAAFLYIVAWLKRHQWVYSVTLGGTAIEPMVLTVAARGRIYQSVGNEAREGAIRLV